MNTNKFAMTYQEVETTVNQLSRLAETIKDELNQVSMHSSKITNDFWRGKAEEAYYKTYNDLKPKFEAFHGQIMECISYLNMAMGKNKSTDENISATFAE